MCHIDLSARDLNCLGYRDLNSRDFDPRGLGQSGIGHGDLNSWPLRSQYRSLNFGGP